MDFPVPQVVSKFSKCPRHIRYVLSVVIAGNVERLAPPTREVCCQYFSHFDFALRCLPCIPSHRVYSLAASTQKGNFDGQMSIAESWFSRCLLAAKPRSDRMNNAPLAHSGRVTGSTLETHLRMECILVSCVPAPVADLSNVGSDGSTAPHQRPNEVSPDRWTRVLHRRTKLL